MFRSDNSDDILTVPVPDMQGFGYFQNIGSTRRQGFEAEANLKSKTFELYASYALIDARFRDFPDARLQQPVRRATATSSCSPATDPRDPRGIGSSPASIIPSPMRSSLAATCWWSAASILMAMPPTSSPSCPPTPFSTCTAPIRSTKTFQLYGRVDNIFDNRYRPMARSSTPTTLPNFTNGGTQFTDPRSVSPVRPAPSMRA